MRGCLTTSRCIKCTNCTDGLVSRLSAQLLQNHFAMHVDPFLAIKVEKFRSPLIHNFCGLSCKWICIA